MSSSKAEIFNLALGALLLTKQVSDVDSDNSAEVRTLRTYFNTALRKTLHDLDLDGTSVTLPATLIANNPIPHWDFAYQYPANCAFFRRLVHNPYANSMAVLPVTGNGGDWRHRRTHKDVRSTQIPRQVASYQNQKVIFSNYSNPLVEYIPFDLNLSILNDSAKVAVAYKLADLSSALIAGKGAGPLRKELRQQYIVEKAQAQELDRQENATFDADDVLSEFVEARLS